MRPISLCRRPRVSDGPETEVATVTAVSLLLPMNLLLLSLVLVGSMARLVAAPADNALSESEQKDGWRLLFDGKSFQGWRGYSQPGFPQRGWSIEDGCIKNAKNTGRPGSGGGDIVTKELFTDFEFRFEWKIASGGNRDRKSTRLNSSH